MRCLIRPWGHMHFHVGGANDAPVILWANSLGTDLRMWDAVVALLPNWRHVRFDKPGHGLSATPAAPWDVTDISDDAAALLQHLGIAKAVVVGCSVGGMVAQALAIRHPARVRALVLSNTAAKIGTAEAWQARVDAVRNCGIASIAEAILERWFPADFRQSDAVKPWRTMLLRCDALGYIGTCEALARADVRAEVMQLALPVLMIAGSQDLATPPDLVAQTCALIPGAKLITLSGTGHLPAIDAAAATAAAIAAFLENLP